MRSSTSFKILAAISLPPKPSATPTAKETAITIPTKTAKTKGAIILSWYNIASPASVQTVDEIALSRKREYANFSRAELADSFFRERSTKNTAAAKIRNAKKY